MILFSSYRTIPLLQRCFTWFHVVTWGGWAGLQVPAGSWSCVAGWGGWCPDCKTDIQALLPDCSRTSPPGSQSETPPKHTYGHKQPEFALRYNRSLKCLKFMPCIILAWQHHIPHMTKCSSKQAPTLPVNFYYHCLLLQCTKSKSQSKWTLQAAGAPLWHANLAVPNAFTLK